MGVGENIRALMAKNKITAKDLAAKAGVSPTHLSYVINGKRYPSPELISKLAIILNVFEDKITGEAASCIIENKLKELEMTLEELTQQANVPLHWLQNLDTFTPGEWGGENDIAYKWITQVAEVLGLPGSRLRLALARQEIPAYDGPTSTPEEIFDDFFNENAEEPTSTLTPKEERDIAKDLERMLSNLESKEALAFNGEPLNDETKELMRISLESSMRMGKQIAKQKFTPKKHKK